MNKPEFAKLRDKMIQEQIVARGIADTRVVEAIRAVPRHRFVPDHLVPAAYEDKALPIGPEQTISQPFIVALMLESAAISKKDKVLEIGTGSGYQTAILSRLATHVYSIELDSDLLERSQKLLKDLGCNNVTLVCGNGFDGMPKEAPFDVILVTAAPEHVPRELVRELAVDGRLILPLGDEDQELVLMEKTRDGLVSRDLGGVRFVKMQSDG